MFSPPTLEVFEVIEKSREEWIGGKLEDLSSGMTTEIKDIVITDNEDQKSSYFTITGKLFDCEVAIRQADIFEYDGKTITFYCMLFSRMAFRATKKLK